MSQELTLAIDLGTYNSAAAVLKADGQVVQIASSLDEQFWNGTGQRIKPFPSVVVYSADGSIRAVGHEAKSLAEREPRFAIWGVKRLLGKTFKEAQEHGELDRMQIPVEPDEKNGRCVFIFEDRDIEPEDVSAAILSHIRSVAQAQIGAELASAVISIPAYFDAVAIGATVDAARRAGFASVQTVPEPVAAALAYDVNVTRRPFNFLVFDLGGGTLDVTAAQVRRINSGPNGLACRCLKNTGDTHLGGLDMDDRLVALLSDRMQFSSMDAGQRLQLRRAAEAAKIALSTATEAQVVVLGSTYCLTRRDLDEALRACPKDLIQACKERVKEALGGAGWRVSDLDRLLLVGGPTEMPCIRKALAEVFRGNPAVVQQIHGTGDAPQGVDPMLAVAVGAARFGKSQVVNVQPYGYGFINIRLQRTPGKQMHELIREPYMLVPRDSEFPSEPQSVIPDIPFYQLNRIFSVDIIQQVPDTEQEVPGVGKRKYRLLGKLKLAFLGEEFEIQISMRLNDNGELETTLTNLTGTETITYTGVGAMRRHPIELPTFEFRADDECAKGKVVFVPTKAAAIRKWGVAFHGFIADHVTAAEPDLAELLDDLETVLRQWGQHLEADDNAVYMSGKSLLHRARELRLMTEAEWHRNEDELTLARSNCFRWEEKE